MQLNIRNHTFNLIYVNKLAVRCTRISVRLLYENEIIAIHSKSQQSSLCNALVKSEKIYIYQHSKQHLPHTHRYAHRLTRVRIWGRSWLVIHQYIQWACGWKQDSSMPIGLTSFHMKHLNNLGNLSIATPLTRYFFLWHYNSTYTSYSQQYYMYKKTIIFLYFSHF